MHTIGTHFIEKVTAVENTSTGDHTEAGQIPLKTTKFQATIRGLGNKVQQHRSATLLALTADRMTTTLHRDNAVVRDLKTGGRVSSYFRLGVLG